MRRFLSLCIVLLLLAGVLAWWQKSAARRGAISLPQAGALAVLRPGQRVLHSAGDWMSDVARVLFRRGDIVSQNTRLHERLAEVQSQNERLRRYKRENEELAALLKMTKPATGSFLAAQIVAQDATDAAQSVFINVSARQGVKNKDVVFTAEGVVGQIIETSSRLFPVPSSQVLLLTDRRSGVGAVVARSGAGGVVQGTGGQLCKLDYVDDHADVREGDLVLTSGLMIKSGGVFPRGLVIGRILKVERDKTLSRLSAYVDPAVPFRRIAAVWVATGG